MRVLRTLLLAAATVVAALALTAGTAAAQESSVEVVWEEGPNQGQHCSPTCPIEASGTSSLTGHMFGIEIGVSACDDVFGAEVGEDGSGHVTSIAMTGPNCNLVPCTTGGTQDEWPFVLGEVTSGEEHMDMVFCLLGSDGSKQHCPVEGQIHAEDPPGNPHHYNLSVNDWTCPSGVELDASWEIHGDDLELVHN